MRAGGCQVTLRAAIVSLAAVIATGCPPPDRGRVVPPDGGAASGGGPDAVTSEQADAGTSDLPEDAGQSPRDGGVDAGTLASGGLLGSPPGTCPEAFAALPQGDAPRAEIIDAQAEETLTPAWERRPSPGRTLSFEGVADAAGNLFWTESSLVDGTSELVSASREGAIRFRAPSPRWGLALAGTVLVSAAVVTGGCSGPDCLVVEGRRTSDGARAWRRDLLPVLQPWMRKAGSGRYGSLSGIATSGGLLLVGASILDSGTAEHESGYVGLDLATGEVLWSARTSAEGNAMMSGAPIFAQDGEGYGSRTVDYLRDDILLFPGGEAPRPLASDGSPWHGGVVAAYGALLVTNRTTFDPSAGAPLGLEVRCRADGRALAGAGSVSGTPILSGASAWFVSSAVARHDAATGALLWRVTPVGPPPVDSPPAGYHRPAGCSTTPILTQAGSLIYADQEGVGGRTSSEQALGAPVLHELDLDGREVLRRRLPLETECYTGPLALQGGRLFLGGQVLPAAGAYGVVRAFDVRGREAAERGWITTSGSMARDNRAR